MSAGNADSVHTHSGVVTVPCVLCAAQSQLPWRGVNLAGAEFGEANPGEYRTAYIYPVDAENYTPISYYVSLGMNTFRVPFRWVRGRRCCSSGSAGSDGARSSGGGAVSGK